MFADFSPKKPGRGVLCMCQMPFNLTAEECELAERGRDAETAGMENADSEDHLSTSNSSIKRY